MESSNLYNLEKLVEFRHWMHENAELSMVEYNTHAKIIEYVKSLGIQDSVMITRAGTGLTVDVYGTATPKGKKLLIAARADIDALPLFVRISQI
jgi:metal-dependent amidase/aminoacylase/carboxypeptidase family protein